MVTRTFKEAILNRRMLICVFTGFTSGLPLYLLIQLVPAWLRAEGVGLAEIGFFALIGFPYTWKFVWAPVMDRFTLPFLGHRRGWMLVTQLALLVSIAAMGFIKPHLSLWTVAYLAAAIAFFSASQDIVLDAYRRELLPDVELGLGNAIHVQTYRLAGLVPGSLALILSDHLPWHTVFMFVALFMCVGIVLTLVIDEAIAEPSPPKTMRDAIVEPFREFIGRKGIRSAALILVFLFLYKLGDNMATALQTPFFIDMGFSRTAIGSVEIRGTDRGDSGWSIWWCRHDQARHQSRIVDFRRCAGREHSRFCIAFGRRYESVDAGCRKCFRVPRCGIGYGCVCGLHGARNESGVRRNPVRAIHGADRGAEDAGECRNRRHRRKRGLDKLLPALHRPGHSRHAIAVQGRALEWGRQCLTRPSSQLGVLMNLLTRVAVNSRSVRVTGRFVAS